MTQPSEAEARLALHGVEVAQRRVIGRIGMPWWYWWGLALCWVGLGVLSDLDAAWWIVSVATVAVGSVHASVSQRLLGGRQQGKDVRVRAAVAGRRASALVVAFLLGLVAATVALALALDADGAGHPATWASGIVAIVIVLGGPRLMLAIRDDAARRAAR
jgi:hypothetical protein